MQEMKLSKEKEKEIMLAINLELFEKNIINQKTYERANKAIQAA